MNERRRGNEGPATSALRAYSAVRLRMSVFVRCELEAGARRARNRQRETERITRVGRFIELAFPGKDFPFRYGEIEFALRAGGRMIPTMDLLIGVHCLCAGEPLLTSDAHFERIPDLSVVRFDRTRSE